MKKKHIFEATGAGNTGKMKIPLVLAPQIWENGNLKPFDIPVSKYLSAVNSYDYYDGSMERDSQRINKNERIAHDKARRAKKLFSQNDDDGNPVNGYAPLGSEVPGTPKEILKLAKTSKFDLQPVLKEDLAVWFGTKKKPKGSKQPAGPWVNICRKDKNGKHPPCGRPEAESKGYPKCRAAGVARGMSDSQKRAACQQKRKAEKKDTQVGKGQKPVMTSYKPKNESIMKRKLSESDFNRILTKILNEQNQQFDYTFYKSSLNYNKPGKQIFLVKNGNTYDVHAKNLSTGVIRKTNYKLPLQDDLSFTWDGKKFVNYGPGIIGNDIASLVLTDFDMTQGDNWVIFLRNDGVPALGKFVLTPQMPVDGLQKFGKKQKKLKTGEIYTPKDFILVKSDNKKFPMGRSFGVVELENAKKSDV